MKPRQQPMKRTEFNRKSELTRTGGSKSSGPVKARRPKRTAVEAEARAMVAARSGGWCEGSCGNTPATDWHHRQNRSQSGKWSAENGMALCRECHAYVTDHPDWGYARGWSVRSTLDPAAIPCLRRGAYVWLLPDGSFEECEMTEIQAWLGGAA